MTFEKSKFDENDPESRKQMRGFFRPDHVDNMIRQAITTCWMVLPDDKQNVGEVENQIRRLVDRALKDLKEDAAAFGIGDQGREA